MGFGMIAPSQRTLAIAIGAILSFSLSAALAIPAFATATIQSNKRPTHYLLAIPDTQGGHYAGPEGLDNKCQEAGELTTA
jgi:hypothetical protein